MSDWIVPARTKLEVQNLACAWRDFFGYRSSLVPTLPRILEIELQKLLPDFVFEVWPDTEVNNDLGRRAYAFTDLVRNSIVFGEAHYDRLVKDDPRARFTAAHELGHLFMHTGERNLARAPDSKLAQHQMFRSAEWQANTFASEFLVPRYVAKVYPEPNLLSQATLTSLNVAENKLSELGLWPPKGSLPDLSFLNKYR